MTGIKYQLKSILRDKMCILTFLLPIIVGIAINLISGVSFQSMSEISFGVLKNNISAETAVWLQSSGNVTEYETLSVLHDAINNPSTQMIGVLEVENTIQTLLSGDELSVNRVIADTLPQVYQSREKINDFKITLVPAIRNNDGLKSLLIVITLVTAMFMGCTFNAMNIISEKENGVEWINQVMPMSTKTYVIQKTFLGFIGGTVSTIATALICMRIEWIQAVPFLIIVFLSAYISALIGLFIGHFSEGLMVGIVYIKIVMILFLAPPILFYLILPSDSIAFWISYLLPSSATFYGVMDLLNGRITNMIPVLIVLLAHSILWSSIYVLIRKGFKVRNIYE